jgi:hypothetical protein
MYVVRNRDTKTTASDTQDVTRTTQGGVKTTPIKTSAVSLIEKPFAAISSIVRKVASIPAAVAQGGSWNRLQPYDNTRSAEGAFTAPIRPDYAPTIYARENIIYTAFGK